MTTIEAKTISGNVVVLKVEECSDPLKVKFAGFTLNAKELQMAILTETRTHSSEASFNADLLNTINTGMI